jgi:hypothetical protein
VRVECGSRAGRRTEDERVRVVTARREGPQEEDEEIFLGLDFARTFLTPKKLLFGAMRDGGDERGFPSPKSSSPAS